MASPTNRGGRNALLVLMVLAVLIAGAPAAQAKSGSRAGSTHVAVARTRASAGLRGVPTIVQTLNNCGPASIAEVLSYWGVARNQQQVAAVVRADGSARGMAPFGVPGYMRSLGMRGMIGVAGTEWLIKALVSNGFPVIVSQWVSAADQIRHYRPIVAYDDRRGAFSSSDPYLGAGHPIGYAEFARIWAVSDGRFLVLYPPSRSALLDAVLAAAGWNKGAAYRHDLAWQSARMRTVSYSAAGGMARYYGYPSLAWDEIELGQIAAARRTLRAASKQGASAVMIGWINAELSWRMSHSGR